ncbi:YopX family protein [Paenibacillus illinoisensis]|uniref:YopX family protein n=1 Tax=Paenibacillus illinoisensis TaxID=59845 RepID=A0ABW8HYK9_9BACL
MREIRYRGKRKDNGEWSYGDLIQLLCEQGQGQMFIVDNCFGACIDSDGKFLNTEAPFVNEVVPETVGQYTGIVDCKVTNIYEGDILRHYSDARMYLPDDSGGWSLQGDPKVEERAPVEWSEEYGRMEAWGHELWIYAERSVIIGNIWDNPNLVEGRESIPKEDTKDA